MAPAVMSDTHSRRELRWDLLEAQPPSGERLTVRAAFANRHSDVLIAVDAGQRRHLLVRMPPDEDGRLAERSSRGLSVQTVELVTGDVKSERFVEIACLDSSGHAALDIIAAELVDAITGGVTRGRIRLVLNVLAKWRRFWSAVSLPLLSRERQLGLFGELWFMTRWLMPSIGHERAVQMWRGPGGARNDFEHLDLAVEVKTTARVDDVHTIHGLEQLVEPVGTRLFLFGLAVREEATSLENLVTLVAQARQQIGANHPCQSQFDAMLYAAGFDDRLASEYAKLMLRVRSEALYSVADGFPRLTPQSISGGVPPGVGQVEYELRLDAAAAFRVASRQEDARELLAGRTQDF